MDDDDEQLAGPSKTRPVFSYTSPSAQQEQEEETDQQAFEEAVMADDGDEDEDGEAIGHMQEVIPGLWIGDIIAARDGKGLKEAGINTIVSILKHEVKYPFAVKSYSLPVDDVASSDILSHIPACVAWIQAAMEESRNREGENLEEGDGIDRAGGILVHCQAGMSRSATIVAAYLMHTLSLTPDEALELIRSKRPVIEPSRTFLEQLEIYWDANCRVSNKDKGTRRWFLERTQESVMNRGEAPDMEHTAKFPATPTPSAPATPQGGVGRRKIRCKMCRRHLAIRDHMMDHILDQSPVSRPRTPSMTSLLPSALGSISEGSSQGQGQSMRSRPPSFSSISRPPVIPPNRSGSGSRSGPVTPMTGMMDSPGQLSPMGSPFSPGLEEDNSLDTASGLTGMKRSSSDGAGIQSRRKHIDPQTLAARLPPQLAALRAGVPGRSPSLPASSSSSPGANSPTGNNSSFSPLSTPISMNPNLNPISRPDSPGPTTSGITGQVLDSDDDTSSNNYGEGGVRVAARRMSMLAMTSTAPSSPVKSSSGGSNGGQNGSGNGSVKSDQSSVEEQSALVGAGAEGIPFPRRGSSGLGIGAGMGGGGWGGSTGGGAAVVSLPILVNPKCSGYWVEPLTWMDPVLAAGELAGRLTCPNEKCKAKIGNYDWAGAQCGCGSWVIPGFCIHRSKVDEIW